MRPTTKLPVSVIAALAGVALFAAQSQAADEHHTKSPGTAVQPAHTSQGESPQAGMGFRMMGPGMQNPGMQGQGMMAPGMMMGPGMMMNPAMMRHMMAMMHGGGRGDGFFAPISPIQHLSVEDVRHALEHRLKRHGNERLKLGEVKATGDDSIVADIVTHDDSLVDRLEVDRHSGAVRRAQ